MSFDIKGIEKIEVIMRDWSPSDLVSIEGMELRSCPDFLFTDLVIQALFQPKGDSWPDFNKEMFRVQIAFDNVRGLHLKSFGGGAVQIMGFDIHFIGNQGMEGINYKIEDYENDRIHFNCHGITILSAERVDK